MSDARQETTLVLGGTGKTGRRVVERLRTRDLPVRVGSRQGEPPFDWDETDTWAPALRGVTSAYISFVPDVAVPGAAATVEALAELAVASGVRRLVLLSGRGELEAGRAEQAVQAAGAEWTIVRCSWFNQNFSEGFFLEPIRSGELALPVDTVPEPFVDAEDIADVAVAALTEDRHAGHVYELTGPRLLRFEQAVEEIERASGRPVGFVPLSIDDYVSAVAEQGTPDEVVWLMRYLFTEVLDGRNAQLADGVQRALGREPRGFGDYAERTAATGVWAERVAGEAYSAAS
ncbi:MAG: NAD(P)H-binding protein [Gaiellaceae bacterium MAG52_C11]|nr:NAD(P)H-binding protein [Candidatus Gaiellasilicea maunaloa]